MSGNANAGTETERDAEALGEDISAGREASSVDDGVHSIVAARGETEAASDMCVCVSPSAVVVVVCVCGVSVTEERDCVCSTGAIKLDSARGDKKLCECD